MKLFGPFRLDTVNQCLWRAATRMPLTPKAFDVLRYLVEHAGRLVTQEEILEALWSETYVNPEGIRKYILEIRKVLGDRIKPALFIETLPKRGYQFVAEVNDDRLLPASSGGNDTTALNMVGREPALARLIGSFEKAMNGQRQLVFVTGEAGIGKTALVDAFQQKAALNPGVRVARGQCIEGFGGKEAYYPMLEAFASMLQAGQNDRLVQTLATKAPTWLAQFPSLFNADRRDELRRETLGSTPARMVREACEALETLTEQSALVVVLEDLHWVDDSTLDILSAFARRREPAKLLLIATYRPVDVVLAQGSLRVLKQDLLIRHLCDEVAIERLEETDVAEYLAKEFTVNQFPSRLVSLVHRNSGGNALFMVAIVREMLKTGLLAKHQERWMLTAPVEHLCPAIPETLQDMLGILLEQLSAEEQQILQSCSVIGERFSVWAAAVMLNLSAAIIDDACDKLAQRQQFIRFAGFHVAPHGGTSTYYEFSHSLFRQALYRSLSNLNRSKLHLRLAESLMSAYTGGTFGQASELAMHFEEGQNYEQAVRFLMLTAESDSRRFAYGDSIRVLEHALRLLPSIGPNVRADLEIQVLQRIGDVHYSLGAMSDSALAYQTAAARAAESGLQEAQLRALSRLAFPAWYLDPVRGDHLCRQAVEVSTAYGDPLLMAQAEFTAARFRLLYDTWRKDDAELCASAHRQIRLLGGWGISEQVSYVFLQAAQGEYGDALKQADAVIMATTSPATYLLALGAKALILIGLGRFGEVLRIVQTGRELAHKNGEEPWLFIFREAWLRALCFDFKGVRQLNEIMMQPDSEHHSAEPNAIFTISSGYAALYQERYAEALQCFERVQDPRATSSFFLHWYWRMRAQLGSVEARLRAGDLQTAQREVCVVLDAALSTAEPNLQALAWEASARVAMAHNEGGRAVECIESALAVLERFEIRVAAWRVLAAAWDVYRLVGEKERAEEYRLRAKEAVLQLADSFDAEEPLRHSLLTAAPVQRILAFAVSA